jgi:hypothetical protein
MVQDSIDQTVAFPLTGTALNPNLVGITFATTITLVPGATQTDKDTAASQAIAGAQDYLSNLQVGQQLIINDIAAAIRNASPKILDVGQPNRQIEEKPAPILSSKSLYLPKITRVPCRDSGVHFPPREPPKPPFPHSALPPPAAMPPVADSRR